MTNVHCTVSDCHYWGDHNHCTAKEILVVGFPVPPTTAGLDHHGRGADDAPPTPVDRKDGTYCFTFEHE